MNDKVKEIETRIYKNNNGLLKLKEFKLTDKNYKQFLNSLLLDYTFKYDTLYENGDFYCSHFERRSLGDIFLLTKFYFPNVSLKQILNYLYVNIKPGYDYFSVYYCSNIYKRVYSKKYYDFLQIDKTDEFGMKVRDYQTLLGIPN